MFDYMVTAFNVLAGLITKNILMTISYVGIGIFLVWIVLQLIFCFQTRFNGKCVKMYNFMKKNENNTECMEFIDNIAGKTSIGFAQGWKNFKTSQSGKPSDFITRENVLDKEINSGFLNNGKSFMKSYIWFVTVVLFIFNLSFVSSNVSEVAGVLAFSLVLPAITYFILKILYYAYTSIRQQIYKANVETLFELLDLLDERFEKKNTSANLFQELRASSGMTVESSGMPDPEPVEEEPEEADVSEENYNEELEESMMKEHFESRPPEDFDMLEDNKQDETASSESREEPEVSEVQEDEPSEPQPDNVTEIGKEAEDIAEEHDEEVAVEDAAIEESPEETPEESQVTEVVPETEEKVDEDVKHKEDLDKYDIFKKKNIDVDKIINEVPNSASKSSTPYINVDSEYVITDAYAEEDAPIEKTEVSEQAAPEITEKDDEDLSEQLLKNTMSNEKAQEEKLLEMEENLNSSGVKKVHKSKLAMGGVEIIKNDYHGKARKIEESSGKPNVDIQTLDREEEKKEKPKAVKSATKKEKNTQINVPYQNAVSQVREEPPAEKPEEEVPNYFDEKYSVPSPVPEFFDSNGNEVSKTKTTKPKAKRKKKINTKKGDGEVETLQTKKTRGRPRNEVNVNSLEITDDRQFNDVLARAEKLMRKSEEGLSQSQSKRIENELKLLIEAMNKYKENKS